MLVDHGLELLSEEEARELLDHSEIGRVGVTMGAIPAIFPVNYAIVDDLIVFRTAPGSKLSAATEGAVVAFAVDEFDGEIGRASCRERVCEYVWISCVGVS